MHCCGGGAALTSPCPDGMPVICAVFSSTQASTPSGSSSRDTNVPWDVLTSLRRAALKSCQPLKHCSRAAKITLSGPCRDVDSKAKCCPAAPVIIHLPLLVHGVSLAQRQARGRQPRLCHLHDVVRPLIIHEPCPQQPFVCTCYRCQPITLALRQTRARPMPRRPCQGTVSTAAHLDTSMPCDEEHACAITTC